MRGGGESDVASIIELTPRVGELPDVRSVTPAALLDPLAALVGRCRLTLSHPR